jgi:hypothetical protein
MAKTLKIKIDWSALTIGDLVLFDRFQDGSASQTDLVQLLDRVVEGGASHLPLTALHDIMSALQTSMTDMVDPVIDGKN